MHRPLIYETCDSPEGMRLGFVGDSQEHFNRNGSTREQYWRLAGGPAHPSLHEKQIIARRALILEDFNRSPEDTVIGGAHIIVAKPSTEEGLDFHLVSAFIRDEYRRKGLGNFTVGRLLGTTLGDFPGTRLLLQSSDDLDGDMRTVLKAKGFKEASNGSVLSLNLPGRQVWPRVGGDISEVEEEIAVKGWTGRYGDRVYRGGKFVGEILREEDGEDWWSSYQLVVADASGAELDRITPDNDNVDWNLSAAIALVNQAGIK